MAGRPEFNPLMDILSGTIMALTSIPQLLSYAETTGYASHIGLTTAGPSLIAWGLSTGSPWLNSGVTSVTALMTKTDLDGENYALKYGEEEYVKVVAAYSFMVGVASLLLIVIGFGSVTKHVPKTVKAGFKWGCAVGVLCSALPNGLLSQGKATLGVLSSSSDSPILKITGIQEMLPFASGGLSTVSKIIFLLLNPMNWDVETCGIFLVCSLILIKGKKVLPKFCPTGTDVILATGGATLYCILTSYGGAIVGEMPIQDTSSEESASSFLGGLIDITDPQQLIFETIPNELIPRCFQGSFPLLLLSASILAAVNFLSIVGIASAFESENAVLWSPNRELGAQGVACLVAGLTGSAPVSGSLSRSLVSRMAGSTSQLACIVTGLCWICLLPYLKVVENTPKAALSSVIVCAVVTGICWPKDLLKFKGGDMLVGWGTGLFTMCTSPTLGFGFGICLFSVVALIDRVVGGKQDKKKVL